MAGVQGGNNAENLFKDESLSGSAVNETLAGKNAVDQQMVNKIIELGKQSLKNATSSTPKDLEEVALSKQDIDEIGDVFDEIEGSQAA